MAISVIGVDFRTAPVELREQVALSNAQTLELLHTIAAEKMFAEAMVISTCNRTEFYFTGGCRPEDPLTHLLWHVAQVKGAAPITDTSAFFRHQGPDAVRHLFRVAGALESQIVGEHEIVGQIKNAYALACEARTARFLVHKLAHWAFRCAKRVLSQTQLGQGTASVSQAAVELAKRVFTDLSGKRALLVGAGQTAELAAQALVRAGVTDLSIVNRTVQRAEQLAQSFRQWHEQSESRPGHELRCPALVSILAACGLSVPAAPAARPMTAPLSVSAAGLDNLPQAIAGADLVICSTGATEPVLTDAALGGIVGHRNHPLLIIDIAVPRDVDERLGRRPNVFLYNINALDELIERNIEVRRKEIPKAQAIVADEVERFNQWLNSLDVVPTIRLLEQRLNELQESELAKYARKLDPQAQKTAQEFARSLCKKIMHGPVVFLRGLDGANGQDDEPNLAAVNNLRQIFRLDKPEEDE